MKSTALFEETADRKGTTKDAMGMTCINAPDYRNAPMSPRVLVVVFGFLVFCAAMTRCAQDAKAPDLRPEKKKKVEEVYKFTGQKTLQLNR